MSPGNRAIDKIMDIMYGERLSHCLFECGSDPGAGILAFEREYGRLPTNDEVRATYGVEFKEKLAETLLEIEQDRLRRPMAEHRGGYREPAVLVGGSPKPGILGRLRAWFRRQS